MTHTEESKGLPSASNMAMLEACPPSWQMIQLYGDKVKPDALALSCTAVHAALEEEDTDGLDEEEVICAEELAKMRDQMVQDWMARHNLSYISEPVKEHRLWIHRDGKEVASAKLDFYVCDPPTALVIDYTCGYVGKTPADSNWQIRTQVVALKEAFPELTFIDAAIPHYRLKANPGDVVTYSEDDLVESRRSIMHAIWKLNQPGMAKNPGPHCRYCPGKAWCKPHAAYTALDVLPASKKDDVIKAAASLTPEQLVYFWMNKKPLIKPFMDACRVRLDMMTDEELAAYGVIRKPSTRDYVDTQQGKLILEALGMKEADVYTCMSLSVDKAAEAYAEQMRAVNPKFTTTESKRLIREKLLPVTDKVPMSPRYKKNKE